MNAMKCKFCGNACATVDTQCVGCGVAKNSDTVTLDGTVGQMPGREPDGEDLTAPALFGQFHDKAISEAGRVVRAGNSSLRSGQHHRAGLAAMDCRHCGGAFTVDHPSCPGCGAPKTAEIVRRELSQDSSSRPSWMANASFVLGNRKTAFGVCSGD